MSDQDKPADEPADKPAAEPKIIVDDDWKAQVEKEKAAATAKPEPSSDEVLAKETEPAQVAEPAEKTEPAADDAGQLPPASLEVHISMLFSQCMAALGQMPGPDGQPTEVNKPFAKHFIDTIEMLQEKTSGNVTDDEKKMMAEVLHAMRMAFVSVK